MQASSFLKRSLLFHLVVIIATFDTSTLSPSQGSDASAMKILPVKPESDIRREAIGETLTEVAVRQQYRKLNTSSSPGHVSEFSNTCSATEACSPSDDLNRVEDPTAYGSKPSAIPSSMPSVSAKAPFQNSQHSLRRRGRSWPNTTPCFNP